MGMRERERIERVLSGEELSFKRKSMTQRLDHVYADWYKEYGFDGLVWLNHITGRMVAQAYKDEGGC